MVLSLNQCFIWSDFDSSIFKALLPCYRVSLSIVLDSVHPPVFAIDDLIYLGHSETTTLLLHKRREKEEG
jgi:hypothetical protein